MDLMNDFVKAEIIELDVEGKIFKYRPVTAGEENTWLNKYATIVEGKYVQDLSELNKCKLQNIVEVPYPSDLIKQITGVDKPWSVMNSEERWLLFAKLKPSVFTKIIQAMDSIDDVVVEKKT